MARKIDAIALVVAATMAGGGSALAASPVADVPAPEAALMAATQRPVAAAALAFMANPADAIETVAIEAASHALMVSHAGAVAALIEDAASRP